MHLSWRRLWPFLPAIANAVAMAVIYARTALDPASVEPDTRHGLAQLALLQLLFMHASVFVTGLNQAPSRAKAFAGLAALTAFYGIFATIFTVMFGSNVPLIGLALIILCELPRLVLWTADRERQAPGLPCPQQAIGLSIFVHLGLCAAVASIATTPFGKDGVFAPQPQTPPTATQAFLWWGFWFHLFQTTAIATNALLTAWLQTAWEQYPASARYLCERRMAEAVQAFLFWGPLLLAALAVICFRRQPGISWLAIGFASICLGILAWSTVLLRARFSERRTASTAPAA